VNREAKAKDINIEARKIAKKKFTNEANDMNLNKIQSKASIKPRSEEEELFIELNPHK
jgi:hypothetical protein